MIDSGSTGTCSAPFSSTLISSLLLLMFSSTMIDSSGNGSSSFSSTSISSSIFSMFSSS